MVENELFANSTSRPLKVLVLNWFLSNTEQEKILWNKRTKTKTTLDFYTSAIIGVHLRTAILNGEH